MSAEMESSRCSYPAWLVKPYSWVALDLTASTRLLASVHNITILDQHETQLVCHYTVRSKHPEAKGQSAGERFQIVARATRGW